MPINAPSLMTNPLRDGAIDYSAKFDKLYTRMDNFWKLYNDGEMLADLKRYIPGLAEVAYQGQIKSIVT